MPKRKTGRAARATATPVTSTPMEIQDDAAWSQEYQRFMEQSMQAGQIQVLPSNSEHRQHPRFRLCSNIVWRAGRFQFSIVDLSISGISFDANEPLERDRTITVRLSDLVSVRARVIGCEPMEPTDMFIAGRHRIRCQFEDTVEGLRFLVLVKDMKELRIDA